MYTLTLLATTSLHAAYVGLFRRLFAAGLPARMQSPRCVEWDMDRPGFLVKSLCDFRRGPTGLVPVYFPDLVYPQIYRISRQTASIHFISTKAWPAKMKISHADTHTGWHGRIRSTSWSLGWSIFNSRTGSVATVKQGDRVTSI